MMVGSIAVRGRYVNRIGQFRDAVVPLDRLELDGVELSLVGGHE